MNLNDLIKLLTILSNCYCLNLTILDYHDPLANHILDAEIIDNTLIVSAMIQGIEFYDITNPTELDHIAHFTLSGGGGGGGVKSNCVSANDDYAYFTSNNGNSLFIKLLEVGKYIIPHRCFIHTFKCRLPFS